MNRKARPATIESARDAEDSAARNLAGAVLTAYNGGWIVLHEKIASALREDLDAYVEAREARRRAVAAAVKPAYNLDTTETGGWGVPR